MVFSSVIFIFCFLPLTLAVYYAAFSAGRGKSVSSADAQQGKATEVLIQLKQNVTPANIVLLIASLIFYGWGGVKYLALLVCIILANYLLTIGMEKAGRFRKAVFVLILAIDLGNLLYFKYFNFFADNLQLVLSLFGKELTLEIPSIVLPIGISFYTFQIISYVADVYLGSVSVQKDPLKLMLYVTMFPQLIAGPIVRYKDVNEEIDSRRIRGAGIEYGLRRFIIGFAKKVFLANLCGSVADVMFGYGGQLNTAYSWLGIFCYTFQIFYDFSAYSDMAIGMGRMMGFHFNENFNRPYISESIQEFWRRWHISLSTWFRDYVYIPLGGNRKGQFRTYVNLSIVFLLTGFWHGAAWHYIAWGVYHGAFCIIERLFLKKGLEKLPVFIRRIFTMIVVMIGWVLFRADSVTEAGVYIRNLFSMDFADFKYRMLAAKLTPLFWICFVLAAVFAFAKPDLARIDAWAKSRLGSKTLTLKRIAFLLLWIASVLYLVGLSYNPFIYFQF